MVLVFLDNLDYFLIAIPLELRIGGLWGYIVKIETHIWNLK
jgi:hypothetical protein